MFRSEQIQGSSGSSELSGDDGEGPNGAGRLQLQRSQEAVWSLAAAQSLQGFAQPAPRLVGGAVDLNRVPQDLLTQVDTPSFDQQTTLKTQNGPISVNGTRVLKLQQHDGFIK